MRKLYTIITIIFVLSYSQAQQKIIKPSNAHLRWHNWEQIMFIHFDPATWQNREYDNRSTPLKRINPTKLDTDQWCAVAQSWGAKAIIFVAKHVGGFCWWQTETTEYSVRNTPYKDGLGDPLAELSESCEKYGLHLGVYVYSGDESWGATIGSGGKTTDPSKQLNYNKIYRQQLTEVLSRYGKIKELWFDGGCVVPVDDILEKYAADAVIFGGSEPHNVVRWVGSEDGYCFYPNWYVHNNLWQPVEVDVPLLKNGGHKWFWTPNSDNLLMTTEQFIDRYYKSVGRGAVLLLNSTPDTTGLIPASHVARYKEFGEELNRRFFKPLAKIAGREIKFYGPTKINHIITSEDLQNGQLVKKYRIEGKTDRGWQVLTTGESIGHKRIERIDDVEVSGLRIVFEDSLASPYIKNFEAYYVVENLSWGESSLGLPITIMNWQYDDFEQQDKYVEIDLTKYITEIGTYEIDFLETSRLDDGRDCKLYIREWSVEMYGSIRDESITKDEKHNRLKIVRSQQTLDNFPTILKLKIARGEGRSAGDITIVRQKYE